MKRLPLILLALLLSANVVSASDDWTITTSQQKPYIGVTLANGRIGIVADSRPFHSKEIILAGVFDRAGVGDVSCVASAPVFTDLDMLFDGRPAEQFGDWQQQFDMRRAELTTSVRSKGNAQIEYTVAALQQLPYTALVRVAVVAERNLSLTVRNCYSVPQSINSTSASLGTSEGFGGIPVYHLAGKTNTGIHSVSAASMFVLSGDAPKVVAVAGDPNRGMEFTVKLKKGERYEFSLVGAACTTADFDDPLNESRRMAIFAALQPVELLVSQHHNAWEELWRGDIQIEGDNETQIVVRQALYNIYSSIREGSGLSIAPMGLTSNAYNGHYFWDTEIWVYPNMLLLNEPFARTLMQYRYDVLPKALQNAANHGYKGAMYPWEGDASGEECTPVWALTGTFEHHISADVAIGMWNYYCATQDREWLKTTGYPVIGSVAEFWKSRVTPNADGSYSIINVVGADEYAENVDNNAYTNGAARLALQYATEAAEIVGIVPDPEWRMIADGLVFRLNDNITMEYDGYDGRIVKQADVNMLAYPLGIITDTEQIVRDAEYYHQRMDPNGPAMGRSILSVIYARLGDADKAYELFTESYKAHLREPFGVLSENANSDRPYFITGAGGMLQALLFGFGGLEITPTGIVQRNSVLPAKWQSLTITGVGPERKTFRVTNH